MDHINIISKEAITTGVAWPVVLVGSIIIIALIGSLVDLAISKKAERTIKFSSTVGTIGIVVMLITQIITSIFFKVPTGRYRYEATIDREQMTVAEYEEFMNAYSHSKCKNGIYYFEDWPEDYDYGK